MVLANAVPKWNCMDARGDDSNDTTAISLVSNVSEKACFVEGHRCSSFKFDSYMTTIVSEVLQTFSFKQRAFFFFFFKFNNMLSFVIIKLFIFT